MKIGIIGYGSMGKEIEKIAKEQNIEIGLIADSKGQIINGIDKFDVAIDFTQPNVALENTKLLAEAGKNIVMGTTGWYNDSQNFKDIVEKNSVGFVWGANFSVGVNMFYKVVETAAQMTEKFNEYDIFEHEIHHIRKKDSPGGTALQLAKIVLENVSRKTEILTETSHTAIKPQQYHLSSTRGGEIAGTHSIFIDSLADTIELTHRAKNRTGFAAGAVKASQWIFGKKGFFDFKDVFIEMV